MTGKADNIWAPDYSVVVPVFEAGAAVRQLVEQTYSSLALLGDSFEVILVDDGSQDEHTWATISDVVAQFSDVTAIRLMRNFGKPAAVLCGLSHASGQWVITIDDDLQQRPEDIASLIELKNHDVVVGTYSRSQVRGDVRFFGALKSLFDRYILGLPFRMSPLKLINRKVVDAMLLISNRRPYIPALLAYATSDFVAVPLRQEKSVVGKSRYNYLRRIRQFSNLLISNSGFLLRSTGLLGMLVVLVAIALAIKAVCSAPDGDSANGFALTLSILIMLNGMVLVALGFIGEYLVRLVDQTSSKPAYVVRDVIRSDSY